ncbi:MAG: LptA/OstA family protein [Acidobacteriota bacterium]|nr:LptA/OstA family protein [Acidobacteriota bacterium]
MSVASRRWIRTLSALALAATLLVLTVLVVQRLEKFNPPVPSVDDPAVAGEGDDRAVGVYTGFEFVERVAGKKIFELLSKRTLGLSSGWHEIEGVRLQFFREGEAGPVLTCDGARFNIQTRDAELGGSIRIDFPSGASLTTDAGNFEAGSRRFTANGEVLYVSGGTFGRAQTATYDLELDEILLENGLMLRTATGATLSAATAIYRRRDGIISFPQGGRLTMGQSELEAPLMQLGLEEEDGPPRRIELNGGVTARSTAPNGDGLVLARMERIVGVHDGTGHWQVDATTSRSWIDVRFIGGEGYFERELKAWVLRGVVGDEGLINLRAENGVCIKEVPIEGPVRRGESNEARVWFSEGQATDVEMLKNVIIQGEGVEGRGYRARMSPQAGLLMLHGDPTGPERVLLISERGRLSCDQAQLHNDKGRSEARGNVQGQILNVSLIGRSASDASQPTHFASEILDVTDEGGIFHLRENARLWQGHRLLLADDVVFHQDAATVRATGHVRTTFPASQLNLEGDEGEDVVVVARSLDFDDNKGSAIYRGNVRYSDPGHTLAASELSVFFDDNNEVTTVEAEGSVELVIVETGRRMTGQLARRDVQTQLVTITGSPVRLTDPGGNVVSGSSLTWNQADGTVSVAGGTETIYYPEETP